MMWESMSMTRGVRFRTKRYGGEVRTKRDVVRLKHVTTVHVKLIFK